MDLSDISIIPLLPPNLAKDKNVRAMCRAFDGELRRLVANIPGVEIIPNLARKRIADNFLLDLLAWQFHCDFYSADFPIERKREIILKSLDWHTRKGTPSVSEEIASVVFLRAEVKEWFDYGGLPYRFVIRTDEEAPDPETRGGLVRAINSVKNTRSFLEKIVFIIYHEDELHATDTVQIKLARRMAAEGVEIRDVIAADIPQNYEDHARARAVYDGAFAYNGERSHSGFLDAPFYDALKAEIGKSAADNETAAESLAVRVGEPLDESLAGPEDALAIG
ncbi:MAG: phage tail protein, partial [Treponema sp.]|nr:phage tail protein [Treponema sp.]